MNEFWGKVIASGVLTLLIKVLVACAGHWIAWWLAGVISLVVVFGGWFFIDGDWDGAFH